MDKTDRLLEEQVLQHAKELVKKLESGDTNSAKQHIDKLAGHSDNNLFQELGKLTRDLHNALNSFSLDGQIASLAAHDIPDAEDRLKYILKMTEQSANKTMDAVENGIPILDNLSKQSEELSSQWSRFMAKDMQAGEFRDLSKQIGIFLSKVTDDSGKVTSSLNEVLMAQDFQDLTGQVIAKVITLVKEVEESLVGLIKMFGFVNMYDAAKNKEHHPTALEGPVIDETRDDVVKGQDEVDDLLSSLGF